MTVMRKDGCGDGGTPHAPGRGGAGRAAFRLAAGLALMLTLALPPGAGGAALVQGSVGSESAWDEGHASRARLIAGGGDGIEVLAGIEIELSEGYKTYWRHAGDSGLPPEIDWQGSQNVADVILEFPAPGRFRDASGTFFGYEDAVILPLRITPRDPEEAVSLSVRLSYGVCKDVCIPAFADLELTLPAARSGSHAARIARALMQVPQRVAPGESHAGLAFGDHAMGDDGRLSLIVEAPEDALLMAEGPDYNWFLDPDEAARTDPEGRRVFGVSFAETPREISEAAQFRFTLVAGGSAIETMITLPQEILRETLGR